MTISVYLNRDAGLRILMFEGQITRSQYSRLVDIYNDPDVFDAHHRSVTIFAENIGLSDLTAADHGPLDQAVGNALARARATVRLKSAVVALSLSALTELRLWLDLAKPSTRDRIDIASFTNLEDAVAWHGLSPEWVQNIKELRQLERVGHFS